MMPHSKCLLTGWRSLKGSPCHAQIVAEPNGTRPTSIEMGGMDNYGCLAEWLRINGANLGRANLQASHVAGTGLVANSDMEPGDVVFSIPMHTSLMVYPFDTEHNLKIEATDLPDTAIKLALKLLKERDEGILSPWYPYINSLPKKLPNPMEMAQGLGARHMGSGTFPEIIQTYKRTLDCVVRLGQTHDNAQWALSVVQSRAFGNGMGQELLVPFLDYMNHGDIMNDSVFSEDHQENVVYGWQRSGTANTPECWNIVVKAKRLINEGEELLVSYGDHQNEYFYLFYGFTPMFNMRDDLVLFEGLDTAFGWYCSAYPHRARGWTEEERKKLMSAVKEEGEIGKVIKLNICSDGSVSPIMRNFFTMIFDGQEDQADLALARMCYESVAGLTSFLDDLQQISDAYKGELNLFEYYYAAYHHSITSFAKRMEIPLDKHTSPEQRLSLQKGSRQWWFVVHEALKKQIAWDFILDVCPTKEDLGL